jgi:hypothetical protein
MTKPGHPEEQLAKYAEWIQVGDAEGARVVGGPRKLAHNSTRPNLRAGRVLLNRFDAQS